MSKIILGTRTCARELGTTHFRIRTMIKNGEIRPRVDVIKNVCSYVFEKKEQDMILSLTSKLS